MLKKILLSFLSILFLLTVVSLYATKANAVECKVGNVTLQCADGSGCSYSSRLGYYCLGGAGGSGGTSTSGDTSTTTNTHFIPGEDKLPTGWTWTQNTTPCEPDEYYCYQEAVGKYQHGVAPTGNDTGGDTGGGGSCWTVNNNEMPQNQLTPTCAPRRTVTPTPVPSCSTCLAKGSNYFCTTKTLWGSSTGCSTTDITNTSSTSRTVRDSYGTDTTCQRCEAPTATPTNTPTPVSKPLVCGSIGDVDNDGKITDKDADAVLKILSGNITPSDDQKKRADVSGNGNVAIEDSLAIRKYVSGILSTFDACPTTAPSNKPNCDPVKDGTIDQLDFQKWKDEFTTKVGNSSACFSPNNTVDLLGFQVWKDIAVFKIKQPF